MSEYTTREKAEHALTMKRGRYVNNSQTKRLRGIGWAILDHADAVRELAAAVRERQRQFPRKRYR